MSKKSAVEMLIFKPNSAIPPNQRGIHENLWIKQRFKQFKQYLSIGIYLDSLDLKYYFFENCDNTPKIYSSLLELKKDLPIGLENIFEETPKLFIMGHGHGGRYGLGNIHGPSEEILNADFDKLIADFKKALPEQHEEISVTLEGCNTDNRALAAKGYNLCLMPNDYKREPWNLYIANTNEGLKYEVIGLDNKLKTATIPWDRLKEFPRDASRITDLRNQLLPILLDVISNVGHTPSWEVQEKTFLERLSTNHPNMTFCGTGPWDPNDEETGYRASGGFPILNAPITSMVGGIWKHGNSVIFHHYNYQVVVRKSMFASTETAKELKINTLKYACEILEKISLDSDAREKMITDICANRDILKIKDLENVPDFPQVKFEDQKEEQILEKEKNNYIRRVREILTHAKSGGKFKERDLLIIALGLKELSVFNGQENLREEILANKALLQLVMVACGKVLIAGPSNDSIIDLLLDRGIDINSIDKKGMTALHYAVQNFYNYREEPLNLINKLLDFGANLELEYKESRTPSMLATEHSRKGTVIAGGKLLELLQRRLFEQSLLNPAITSGRNANCFFQSFMHVFTRLPNKIYLQLLQDSQYKLSLRYLVENFNQAYSKLLPTPFNLKEIIEFSRILHPLDRELIFGSVLRATYNTLVKAKLIQTEPLGLSENVLAHQRVAFANCFGAHLNVYMPEEELNIAQTNGMPPEITDQVSKFKVVVEDAIFVCDRQVDQPSLWKVNLVFAGDHLNYTHGTLELNQHEREQVIISQSTQGACFASAPVDFSSAPLFTANTEDILAFRMVKLFNKICVSKNLTELLSTNKGLFRRLEDRFLEEHRHDDPRIQHEYDNRFGLALKQ